MSSVWSNFSTEKLVNLIGENQLITIEEILPVINSSFRPNDFQKRSMLAKIFESFSGSDSLRNKKFRKELFYSLKPELKESLLYAFGKSNNEDYEKFINHLVNKNWIQSEDINKICEILSIPLSLIPEPSQDKPTTQIFESGFRIIDKPFKQLKDYQFPVVSDAFEKLENPLSRCMIQMPTGSGKTRVAMEIISQFLNKQKEKTTVVWLAHSAELLEQSYQCFLEVWSHLSQKKIETVRLWGDADIPHSLVTNTFIFGGFQKLYSIFSHNENAFNHFKDSVKLIVVDEAHRVLAPTYNTVTKGILGKSTQVLGLSATPGSSDRQHHRELARFFHDELITIKTQNNESVISYLRSKKVLSKVTYEPIHIELNPPIRPSPKQLEYFKKFFDIHPEILKKLSLSNIRNIEIVKRLDEECKKGGRIIFFACSVKHSKQICAFLTLLGVKAAHLDGSVSKSRRENIIKKFTEGDIQLISNFELLSTGFDAPKTDVVFISRPTFSIVLYAQMIGRGLRGPEIGGSENCKIIDVKDNIQGYSDQDSVYDYFQEYFNVS
jgi:DNA repair protein RadD